MTMRIARSETIGGISAIEVRNRLGKYGDGFRADWVTDMGYSEPQGAALIVGLLEGGYITVDTTRRNENTFPWYKLTDLGRSLVRASAAPPVKRQTADRTLREFMARVEEVNNSSRFLYRITEVVVYGSYLRGAASLGDLDLACEYEPTIENPDERTKATRKHFEESGRVYSRIGDDFHWSLQEVQLFLKNRQRTISLHPMHDFLRMPKADNFSYQVLLGDPEQIAARLSTSKSV